MVIAQRLRGWQSTVAGEQELRPMGNYVIGVEEIRIVSPS